MSRGSVADRAPRPKASFERLETMFATPTPAQRILRIDSSMRVDGSTTRSLADQLIAKLADGAALSVTRRDLAAETPSVIDANWIAANFTEPADRTAEQKAALAESDALVAELQAADTIVIAAPIYNFGPPAALKAWIDQVARARVTFRYTPTGPEGLLSGKKAYLLVASGGTEAESAIDFTTPYLRHVLGFLGITDVTIVAADRQMADPESATRAGSAISALSGA